MGENLGAALGHAWRRWLASIGALLAGEREQWALWVPVGLGLGICFYFLLPDEPHPWAGGQALFFSLLLTWYVRGRGSRLLYLIPALMLLVLSVGFAAAQLRAHLVAAPVLTTRIGPTMVEGRVVSVEARRNNMRVVLDRVSLRELPAEATPERVRIRVSGEHSALRAGEKVRLRAMLMPPPAPVAPGAYDFQRRAYFQRLGGVGYSLGGPQPVAGGSAGNDGFSFRLWLADFRARLAARVREGIPGDGGAIAAALLTGARGAISKPALAVVRDSGLAHLLAISGLHIGLVAGLLFFACRGLLALMPWVALRYPIKKWAAVAALIGAFLYLLVTGATVPTQRAFIMTGLVLLAVLVDRTAISLRLVAWAAVIILMTAPESLLGPSFQMSFAAVVALVAVYESLRGRLILWRAGADRSLLRAPDVDRGRSRRESTWRSLWRIAVLYLGGVMLTTLVASLATMPFVIFHFNRFAAYGLLANLLAVPLTALWIMPWGLVVFFLMPMGLEELALAPMGWGIDLLIMVAERVAGLPGAKVLLPSMPISGLSLVALGGLWLLLWRHRWRFLGAPVIAAGLLSLALSTAPDILVSGDAKLMAVRGEGGEWLFSSQRAGRAIRERWLRMAGKDRFSLMPEGGVSPDGRLSCDGLGCLYRVSVEGKGWTVALVRDEGAFIEDCAVADVVIATVPLRAACEGPSIIIDRFDLWRNGAHALWLGGDGPRVESVRARQGRRPWAPQPRPRNKR